MKLSEKLTIVSRDLTSIATHSDEDAAVREAALDRIAAMVEAHRANVKAEVKQGIEAALGKTE